MAIAINHAFVSNLADGADTSIVRPSNWNAALVWSGLGTNQILYSTGATTLAQSSNFTFDGTLGTIAQLQFTGSAPSGAVASFYRGSNAAQLEFGSTTPTLRLDQASLAGVGNFTLQWGNQTNTFAASSNDTSLNRGAAGVVRAGDGGNNANGKFNCSRYQVAGVDGVASFGPAGVTSITVSGGIITAIS